MGGNQLRLGQLSVLGDYRSILDHHVAILVRLGLAELEVGDCVAGVDEEQVGPSTAGELIAITVIEGFLKGSINVLGLINGM